MPAAPVADRQWEFHPARQANPPDGAHVLEINGARFEEGVFRFWIAVDNDRERIDLVAWHPLFTDLAARSRERVVLLVLDGMLGEDGVERWLGRIQSPAVRPSTGESVDRGGFLRAIESLARRATGDRFVLRQATSQKGKGLSVALNTALKHIDHLDKPARLRVTLKLLEPDLNGFPSQDEGDELNRFEDQLSVAMPDSVYAGRVTGEGRRTMNWYVSDGGAASASVRRVSMPKAWRLDLKVDPDPRWEGLSKGLVDVR